MPEAGWGAAVPDVRWVIRRPGDLVPGWETCVRASPGTRDLCRHRAAVCPVDGSCPLLPGPGTSLESLMFSAPQFLGLFRA